MAIGFVRNLLRAFFRSVEVSGLENVPRVGGGVFVAWHPNGLIDPALLLASCPRPILVGARHGLFKWPFVGWLMRAVGAVPIYRAVDAEPGSDASRAAKNRDAFAALSGRLAAGELTALFPEGVSHDAPHLAELKMGAAKLFTQALEQRAEGAPMPAIYPVGIHYDAKTTFRSRALVVFHPPLALATELTVPLPESTPLEARRERYATITSRIEHELRDVIRATESWKLHALMHRTRKLFRAERAHRAGATLPEESMLEREVGYARVWAGYQANCEKRPEETQALLARVDAYDTELRALRLEDADLDRAPALHSGPLPIIVFLQALTIYLLLPPILVVGFLVNVIPYQLLRVLSFLGAKLDKDVATIKALGGVVLFPLAWALFGWLAAEGVLALHGFFPGFPSTPKSAATIAVLLAMGGGALFLVNKEFGEELWRALRTRITRHRYRDAITRLQGERAALVSALSEMVKDVTLPGTVTPEGRVVAG